MTASIPINTIEDHTTEPRRKPTRKRKERK